MFYKSLLSLPGAFLHFTFWSANITLSHVTTGTFLVFSQVTGGDGIFTFKVYRLTLFSLVIFKIFCVHLVTSSFHFIASIFCLSVWAMIQICLNILHLLITFFNLSMSFFLFSFLLSVCLILNFQFYFSFHFHISPLFHHF